MLPMIAPGSDADYRAKPVLERHQRDDEVGCVSERRVQQTAHCLAGAVGKLLCRAAKPAGERNDGQRCGSKDQSLSAGRCNRSATATGTKISSQSRYGFTV